jgi:hypothetical protein
MPRHEIYTVRSKVWVGHKLNAFDAMITYLKDEVGAEQQTPNGFVLQVKGTQIAQLTVFVILTDEYILFSAPIFEISNMSPHQALNFTISSPFGLSIMGESFVLKHVVSMDGMNKEKFLKELTSFVAGVEILLPGNG